MALSALFPEPPSCTPDVVGHRGHRCLCLLGCVWLGVQVCHCLHWVLGGGECPVCQCPSQSHKLQSPSPSDSQTCSALLMDRLCAFNACTPVWPQWAVWCRGWGKPVTSTAAPLKPVCLPPTPEAAASETWATLGDAGLPLEAGAPSAPLPPHCQLFITGPYAHQGSRLWR